MSVNAWLRRVCAAVIFFIPLTVSAAGAPGAGSRAPDFTLPAPVGGELTFSDVYRDRGAVLVMLRGWPGYQSPICTAQMAGYITERLEFRKRDFPVVFVYPGPDAGLKEHASEFIKRLDLPEQYRFVIDPGFDVTEDYGLRWRAEGETAYPATFIVDKEGRVVFRDISDSHAGRVPANRAVELIDKKVLNAASDAE